jgi:hypothetical protein
VSINALFGRSQFEYLFHAELARFRHFAFDRNHPGSVLKFFASCAGCSLVVPKPDSSPCPSQQKCCGKTKQQVPAVEIGGLRSTECRAIWQLSIGVPRSSSVDLSAVICNSRRRGLIPGQPFRDLAAEQECAERVSPGIPEPNTRRARTRGNYGPRRRDLQTHAVQRVVQQRLGPYDLRERLRAFILRLPLARSPKARSKTLRPAVLRHLPVHPLSLSPFKTSELRLRSRLQYSLSPSRTVPLGERLYSWISSLISCVRVA